MARSIGEILKDLIAKLETTSKQVQPHIVLGDDDSIYLTERQLGFKEGLASAIRMIEQTDTTS